MKTQKFNNLLSFIDLLFCITMTYVALFVLSVTQIKKIEVTLEEHQSLQTQYEQAITKTKELESDLTLVKSNLSSTQQQLEEKEQLLNSSEDATKTAKERAESLASKLEELDQEVARLRGMGNWRTSAKLAIEITWKKVNSTDDDIDIYIQSPDDSITYFGDKIGQGLFIDRDDLGNAPISDNHVEVTQFFQLLKTDKPYLVNLHAFKKNSVTPTPVTLKLYEISESEAKVIFEKVYTFSSQDQIEPVVEIYTKGTRNYEYDRYIETTKKIDIINIANKSRRQVSSTNTITIRPEDIDPRFLVPSTPNVEKKK